MTIYDFIKTHTIDEIADILSVNACEKHNCKYLTAYGECRCLSLEHKCPCLADIEGD